MTMHLLQMGAAWAWKTSLATVPLIALTLLATLLLRRATFTPIRYLLGLLVVARLLMPFAPSSPLSVFNLAPSQAIATPRTSIYVPLANDHENISNARSANVSTAMRGSSPRPRILSLLWAAGVLAMLWRVLAQHLKVRRWVAGGSLISKGAAFEVLHEAKGISGIQRDILLLEVKEISSPALFGFWRPAILLPPRVAQGDAKRLRLVLLHELAHIKRWDVLIRWLMILARLLHWFNPLVWLSMRRLTAEQELLCDGDVLRLVGPEQQRTYAETLLALACASSVPPTTVISISANFKQLKERIGMIRQFKPATQRWLMFVVPPVAAIIAVVTFTAAIRKPPTTKEAASPKPKVEERSKRTLAVLRDMLNKQTEIVEKKSIELDRYRNELGIVGDPPNSESISSEHLGKIHRIWEQLSEIEKKISDREDQIRVLKKGSVAGVLTDESDPGLSRLVQEQEITERDLTRLSQDRGADHPEVKVATARYKSLNEQIDKRIAAKRDNLEASLESDARKRDELRTRVAELESLYRQKVERSRPYFRAKRDLEILETHRNKIYTRLLEEQVEVDLQERTGASK